MTYSLCRIELKPRSIRGLQIRVYFTFQDLSESWIAGQGQRSAVGALKQTLELYKEQPRPSGASGAVEVARSDWGRQATDWREARAPAIQYCAEPRPRPRDERPRCVAELLAERCLAGAVTSSGPERCQAPAPAQPGQKTQKLSLADNIGTQYF